MKFSIILPIYRVERYLAECIESVLSQDFTDYELILVDDGSPDNCPAICDEYAGKYEKVKVIHQPNSGQAAARNKGLSIAKGEYIVFIDSDDYLSATTALSQIDNALNGYPDVLIYGYKKFFESSGTFGPDECKFPVGAENVAPSDFLMQLIKADSYTGTAWAKVLRKQLLIDNNISFKKGMISEDIDWFFQVMLNAKSYKALNKALYVYRMRPDSISHSAKEKSLIDNIWIKENWPAKINSAEIPDDLRLALMHIMSRYMGNLMVLYASYGKEIRGKYYGKMKSLLPLLDYAITPRARKIQACIKALGFKLTVALLVIANKLKKRT